MAYITDISIKWTYPKDVYTAYNSDESYGRGVYQVTRLFGGNESLLYIGLVKKSNRNFYERLDEHWPWLKETRGRVFIRFGRILPRKGFKLTEELIETIEGVMIFDSQPHWNDKKLNSFTIHKNLRIQNSGYRGYVAKTLDTRDFEI